ncbi:MAG: aminotransferase class I and II [Rhodothermales bacterium]|nr:aminotransferase class I and II [Rhodothermales bacterium]MCA0270388.1 aminotransferase class I and II [Bacteroidota bacterium]
MTFPTVEATRYIVPLKEGGSLPAVVETTAGDVVVKFRGAGQGARALIAELIVGELARRAGLPMPDLSLVMLPEAFGRTERDPEIQDLLKASVGLNVGLGFIPAALPFDPVSLADAAPPELAADVVWLDAFAFNLDRTVRNPNLLVTAAGTPGAPPQLWLIDHGAALYFHHNWASVDDDRARSPFPLVKDHVLLPLAGDLDAASERMRARLTPGVLDEILEAVPDELLLHTPPTQTPAFDTADEYRDAYRRVLVPRLADPSPFVEQAKSAQAALRSASPDRLAYRR